MLVIRNAQLAIFRNRALHAFAQELAAHLLEHYPSPCAALGGEPALSGFIERTIKRANEYGITNQGSVKVFAELLIQFGEQFQRSPIREWTNNILAHPDLPGSAKVSALRARHDEATGGRIMIRF
jgi:hypothetical protein